MYSHVLELFLSTERMHLHPSLSSPSPRPDLEMPIQILRVIFVAIKCYVFGLMAQKYSILSTERASSSRYKDKFGGLRGWRRGGEARATRMRRRERRASEFMAFTRGEGYRAGTFTIRLTHVEEARRKGMRRMELTFTSFRGRERERESANREYDLRAGSGHFATYRYLVVVVPYAVAAPPLPGSCARNPKIRVRSFSLLVSHAYLESIEGNEIKFLCGVARARVP